MDILKIFLDESEIKGGSTQVIQILSDEFGLNTIKN
jgi:hypothetical protein